MKSTSRVVQSVLSALSVLALAVAAPAAGQPPGSCSLTQVTASPTEDSFAGGLSADGRYLTLTSKADHVGENPDGSRELFLYDRRADELRQLTHHSDPQALVYGSTLSEDGSRAFFLTNVDPDTGSVSDRFEKILMALDRATGERTVLARGLEEAAVSADGTRAVVITRDDPTGGNPDGNGEVFLLELADGTYTQITDTAARPCPPFPGICPGQQEAVIDEDGSHVAFVSDLDPVGPGGDTWGGVYLYDADRDTLSRVAVHADRDLVMSGDGGTLAFPSADDLAGPNPDPLEHLFVHRSAGDRFLRVPGDGFLYNAPAALDRTGSRLAFSASPRAGAGRDAFVFESETGALVPVLASPGVDDFAAAMTPSGVWISLHSKADLRGGNPDGSFEVHLARCGEEMAPPPPAGDWLTTSEIPGFRVKARITGGGGEQPVRAEAVCIPETLCVSGAVLGRSELFVRIVGPRPNGKLWPTLVRFTTSTVEVWIEQLSSGDLQYYRLEGVVPGSSELTGLFDREGFEP